MLLGEVVFNWIMDDLILPRPRWKSHARNCPHFVHCLDYSFDLCPTSAFFLSFLPLPLFSLLLYRRDRQMRWGRRRGRRRGRRGDDGPLVVVEVVVVVVVAGLGGRERRVRALHACAF